MLKLDLKKTLKALYAPSAKAFSIVTVPPLQALMVGGTGDPNTSLVYQQAVEALYGLAYGCKFAAKKTLELDHTVMPLEGLWWAEDMSTFSIKDKSNWLWTMFIVQPEYITQEMIEPAREALVKKKDLPALPQIRLETYDEGLAAQILYYGAYADEGPTIARLHAFVDEQGYDLRGKHHEIYLSDPRRTAPEKLKTVIRQPIQER